MDGINDPWKAGNAAPAPEGINDPWKAAPARAQPVARPKIERPTGFVDSAVQGFKRSLPETKSLLAGATAAAAGAIGADRVRDAALGYYRDVQKNEVEPLANEATFLGGLKGESSLGQWAGDTLGNFAGQALQSVAAAGAGAAVGSVAPGAGTVGGAVTGLVARPLVRKLVGKEVATLAAEGAAKKAVGRSLLTRAGMVAAPTAMNIGQETGIAYTGRADDAAAAGEQLDQGDAFRAIAAGIPAGLLDTAGEALIAGRFLHGAGKSPSMVRRIAAGAAKGAATEGATEGAQAVLERAGAGQQLTGADAYTDYIENIAAGALGGGVPGGAAGIRRPRVLVDPLTGQTSAVPDPSNGPISRAASTAAETGAVPTAEAAPHTPALFPDATPGSLADAGNAIRRPAAADVITRATGNRLMERGYTREQILEMTPQQAEALLAAPAAQVDPGTGEVLGPVGEDGRPARTSRWLDDAGVPRGPTDEELGAFMHETLDAWGSPASVNRGKLFDAARAEDGALKPQQLNRVWSQVWEERKQALLRDQEAGQSQVAAAVPQPDPLSGDAQGGQADAMEGGRLADAVPAGSGDALAAAGVPADGAQAEDLTSARAGEDSRSQTASREQSTLGDELAISEDSARGASNDARSQQDTGIQDLAERGGPVPEPEQSVAPQLRGPGNQAAPAVGAELPGVSEGGGQAPGTDVYAGADRQQQRLPAGQRTLGDAQGTSEQPAKNASPDLPRTDQVVDGVGGGTGPGTVDASVSAEPRRDVGGAGAVDAAPRGQAADGPSAVATAAMEAATSPENDLKPPSSAQLDAGNFKVGRTRINGLDISIEHPAGVKRKAEHSQPLAHAYGYIRKTESADGEKFDVFLGDRAHDTSLPVFVVDQHRANGSFDESKALMGFATEAEARAAYLANYPKGWNGLGGIRQFTQDEFKAWVRDQEATKRPAGAPPQSARAAAADAVAAIVARIADGEHAEKALEGADDATARAVAVQLGRRFSKTAKAAAIAGNLGRQSQVDLRTAARRSVEVASMRAPAAAQPAGKPAKPAKAAEKKDPAAPGNTEDAGAELSANRRGKSGAGWTWADIEGMNPTMRVREVQKSKIWPRPDLEQLIDDGMPPVAAHVIKQVYDSLSTSPQSRDANDGDLRAYVETVHSIRDALFAWAKGLPAEDGGSVTDHSAPNLLQSVFPNHEGGTNPFTGPKNRDNNHRANLIGGNKPVRALQGGRKMRDAAFKWAVQRMAGDKPAAWRRQYDIQQRGDGSWVAYRKKDRRAVEDDQTGRYTFETRAEAEHRAADDYERQQLNKAQAKKAAKPSKESQRVEAAERTGPAFRKADEDVTSDRLMETFGLRGVNFGNWLKGNSPKLLRERQLHLNHAFDALMDLADLTGLPPKALSLNGMLGLAIGAQGNGGGAAAHFVPGVNEINITREHGAGSLAHEWAHALDHYFAVQAGERIARDRLPFLTQWSSDERQTAGVRPEIRQAFNKIVNNMESRPLTAAEQAARDMKRREGLEKRVRTALTNLRADVPGLDDAGAKKWEQLSERLLAGDIGEGVVDSGFTSKALTGRQRVAVEVNPAAMEVLKLVREHGGEKARYLLQNIVDLDMYSRHLSLTLKEQAQADQHVPQDGKPVTQTTSSEYLREARLLDATTGKRQGGKAYWSSKLEMFARAFQSYVLDRLAAKGQRSDYLTYQQLSEEAHKALNTMLAEVGQPAQGDRFPRRAERERINEAFDLLLGEIKTRENDAGTVALFSRRGWDESFPDAVLAHQLNVVKAHPDYVAAKSGNTAAALRLAQDIVTDGYVQAIRAALPPGSKPAVVPVLAAEAAGNNRIPQAAAYVLAKKLDLKVDDGIVQASKVNRGGADGLSRLGRQPKFEGPVTPGQEYLLLDDTLTQGGTVAQLKTHIEDAGGKVLLVSALTGRDYSRKIALSPETLGRLRDRFGSIENWWRDTFGYGFEGFTESEAAYLLKLRGDPTPESIRDRVAAGGLPEVRGALRSRAGQQGVTRGLAFDQAQSLKQKLTANWGKNAPRVVLVADSSEMASAARGAGVNLSASDVDRVEGMYLGKPTVWLNLFEIRTPERFREVLTHEALGHYGVEQVIGKDEWRSISKAIDQHVQNGTGAPDVRAAIAQLRRTQPDIFDNPETVAKEVIAVMAEKGSRNGLVQRVVAAVRRFLRRIMPNQRWTDPEIRALLHQADRFLRAGRSNEQAQATVRALAFSRNQNGVEFAHAEEALQSRLAQWSSAVRLGQSGPRAVVERAEGLGPVDRSATGAARQGDASREEIREQSARLIQRAKDEGFFWGDDSPILAALGALPPGSINGGAEHQVFVVGEGDSRFVIRATDNGFFGPRSDISPAQYLARLEDYSRTFPSLQTRLIGVSESAEIPGNAVIWTAQPFVRGKKFGSQAALRDAMAARGWKEDGATGVPRYKHEATGAVIEDAHTDNVFQDDQGNLYPFDVVVEALPTDVGALFSRAPADSIDALETAIREINGEVEGGSTPLERVKQWLKDATPKQLKERLRSTWLGALATSHLTELGSDYFPTMGLYSDYLAEMGADRNQLQQEGEEVAEGARKWAGKNMAEAATLFELMHEATILGVDPAEDYQPLQYRMSGKMHDVTPKNIREALKVLREVMRGRGGDDKRAMIEEGKSLRAMLKAEPKRKASYPTLVARWNQLSPEAQAHYRAMRDLYAKRHDQTEAALIQRINDLKMEGGEKRKAVLVNMIRQQHEAQRLQGVYFPLQRFGKYFVAAERGDSSTFLMFESLPELERAVKGLRARGFKITAQGLKSEGKAKDAPSGTFVAEVLEKLRASGVSERTQDEIYQMYLHALPDLSMRKHKIHRKSVPGWDPDALRAFAFNMAHGAHQLARLRYAHKLSDTIEVLQGQQDAKRREESADTARIVAGDAILEELRKRHEWISNPQDSKLTNTISSFGFLYYLGLTPAASLVNLTQTPLITYPYLAAKFGGVKAMNALLAASRDAIRTVGNIQRTLSDPDEVRAHQVLQRMGALDKTQAHNLMGIAEGGLSGHNPAWAKAMEIIGWGFHKTEVVNREATGLAAFRLAREAGQSFDEAVKFAAKAIKDTHYDYTNANRARWMQSGTAKVLLMFRQYSLNTTWHLGRMVWNATKGADPEVKRIARRNLAGILGMSALFSGALGLPLSGVVLGVLNSVAASAGDDDEPWDAETEFRKFLVDMLGEGPARVLLGGVANEVTGADIAGRVSFSQLWFRDADRELDGRGTYYNLLEQAAGPMGGVLKNALVGKQLMDEGHLMRGVETVLPKALKDGLKSLRYATEGVNNLRGDPIVPDANVRQLVLQLAGFTPAEVAERYDANRALKNYEQHVLDRRSRLVDAFALATRTGDAGGRAEVMQQIRKFNTSWPEIRITPRTLKQSMRVRARYSARAESGIVLNKKIAARVREAVGAE